MDKGMRPNQTGQVTPEASVDETGQPAAGGETVGEVLMRAAVTSFRKCQPFSPAVLLCVI